MRNLTQQNHILGLYREKHNESEKLKSPKGTSMIPYLIYIPNFNDLAQLKCEIQEERFFFKVKKGDSPSYLPNSLT